jgi:5-methylcytosine-specific restriction protein A
MPTRSPRHVPIGDTTRAWARERPSPNVQGYDRKWRRLRAAFLQRNPLCASCTAENHITVAMEVHHKEPIALRPDLRLSWDNLQSLCKTCHSRETTRAMGWHGR